MTTTLKTGNINTIVDLLVKNGAVIETVKRGDETCEQVKMGDDSEVKAYYAKMKEEMDVLEKAGLFEQKQAVLIRYQSRSSCVNERPYTLATNMYGWVAGSHFLSNRDGGKFGSTYRGASLQDCIAFGAEVSQAKGATFTMAMSQLPEDVRAAIRAALTAA